jgi:hypothetical protein
MTLRIVTNRYSAVNPDESGLSVLTTCRDYPRSHFPKGKAKGHSGEVAFRVFWVAVCVLGPTNEVSG